MLLFFSISLITIVSILLILSLLPQTPPTFKLKISTQLYAIFFIRPQTFMSRFSPLILYIQHQNALTRIKITVNFTPLPLVLISIRIYLVKKKKISQSCLPSLLSICNNYISEIRNISHKILLKGKYSTDIALILAYG